MREYVLFHSTAEASGTFVTNRENCSHLL